MNLQRLLLFAVLGCAGLFGLTSFTILTESPRPAASGYETCFLGVVPAGAGYEWTWTVTNTNPGNGKNGTMQDLSHWYMVLGETFSVEDIASVEYSFNGQTWYELPAVLAIDKSQDCYSGQVLKFDAGTSGSAPTYYRLTTTREFGTGYSTVAYKSGRNTGCYTDLVEGIDTNIR